MGTERELHETELKKKKKLFRELLEDSRDWSDVKRLGTKKLLGGALKQSQELLEKCKSVGLFIVSEGELERWWREGPTDKNEWFQQAIEVIASDSSSFKEASEFMVGIHNYLKPKSQGASASVGDV